MRIGVRTYPDCVTPVYFRELGRGRELLAWRLAPGTARLCIARCGPYELGYDDAW
jgi:hypothetical protein